MRTFVRLQSSTRRTDDAFRCIWVKEPGHSDNILAKKWYIIYLMHGGGVEVGPPEMPGRCEPSTFRKNTRSISYAEFVCGVIMRTFYKITEFHTSDR